MRAGVHCPTAADIVKRLKTSWTELLQAIFDEDIDEIHRFTSRIRGKGDEFPVSHETCVSAVRLAARRRGVTTLRPHEYSAERATVLSRARGRSRRQQEMRWPPTSQIQGIGWNRVISEAGLELPDRRGRNPAVPYREALRIFLEHFGYLPRETVLRRAFVDRGLPLTAPDPTHNGAIAELRGVRQVVGLFTPARVLVRGRDQFPEIPDECAAAFDALLQAMTEQHGTTPKGYWNLERVEQGLDKALVRLRPGQALTQRNLQDLARGEPEIPGLSVIQRVCAKNGTSFRHLREEAVRRRGRL